MRTQFRSVVEAWDFDYVIVSICHAPCVPSCCQVSQEVPKWSFP